MSGIIVFGASGFIGRHMVAGVGSENISFVTRSLGSGVSEGLWLEADLLEPQSLDKILVPGSTVINLVYAASATAADNIRMAENLVQACIRAKVSRLVHCSTAVVAGANGAAVVDENTECLPATIYERNKYDVEKIFMGAASRDLNVYVLRPTAVIGPGGQNLKKMLSEILEGNGAINFIRSSIHGARKLNLVPVKDVVRALFHLGKQDSAPPGIYICSADDDPGNCYERVEEIIREALRIESGAAPFRLPGSVLALLLKAGRTGSGKFANRQYSSAKLFSTGFQRTERLSDVVREFVLSETAPS